MRAPAQLLAVQHACTGRDTCAVQSSLHLNCLSSPHRAGGLPACRSCAVGHLLAAATKGLQLQRCAGAQLSRGPWPCPAVGCTGLGVYAAGAGGRAQPAGMLMQRHGRGQAHGAAAAVPLFTLVPSRPPAPCRSCWSPASRAAPAPLPRRSMSRRWRVPACPCLAATRRGAPTTVAAALTMLPRSCGVSAWVRSAAGELGRICYGPRGWASSGRPHPPNPLPCCKQTLAQRAC